MALPTLQARNRRNTASIVAQEGVEALLYMLSNMCVPHTPCSGFPPVFRVLNHHHAGGIFGPQ